MTYKYSYRCPECEKQEGVVISAALYVGISFVDGQMAHEEATLDADEITARATWDEQTDASCAICGWAGAVGELQGVEDWEVAS